MNPDDLVWKDTEYKLKFILDNPNFALPQVVRIHQGHMVDEDDALASGQILTIRGKKKIENVTGHDVYGKELNIPITCPYKLRVVSLGEPRRFDSVKELCSCESPPDCVTIDDDVLVSSVDVTSLKSNTILQIQDQVLTSDGDVVGVNCRVEDENRNDDGRIMTLPMHFVGRFVETLSCDQLQKHFLVADLIKEFSLPVNVQFMRNNEKNSAYGPHLGVVTLENKKIMSSVLATTIIENVRHALTFSADLPVTIQVATGIKKNNPYRRPAETHSQVDLKRFDYCTPSDPYSGVTLQMFDDLRTPMIPRRGVQTPRIQQRAKSVNDCQSQYSSTTSVAFSSFELPPKKIQSSASLGRRNKSLDLGKNIENFFKLKGLRKSMSNKLGRDRANTKNSGNQKDSANVNMMSDLDDTRSFVQSDDGHSTADILSIAPTSNGSDSLDSYTRITDSMDSMSIDQSVTMSGRRRLHSRKQSDGDSGICLSGRKHPRSRSHSRSRARMSPDAPSSNPSDTIDSFSEWSLPINSKDSPSLVRKTYSSQGGGSSSSYLWGVESNDIASETEKPATTGGHEYQTDFVKKQNTFNSIMNYHSNNEIDKNKATEITTQTEILSPLPSKQRTSMNEIRELNEDGVCRILETLKFHEFKDTFIENQVNGELLLELETEDLVNDLKLSLFQAKKIVKYIKGWRPQSDHIQTTEASRRNSLNPRDWSENDVYVHMMTINLIEFGQFCIKNQVNGDLLLDILDRETLNSVKEHHHVKITNLESKKLLNFVVKGWRPDVSPKKSAIL